MDHINSLIDFARNYAYSGCTKRQYKYDDYNTCYNFANKFININPSFSILLPEEIIKMFANIKFKKNNMMIRYFWHTNYEFCIIENRWHCIELFEKLIKVNPEMLVAIIKAISAEVIGYFAIRNFYDQSSENVGKLQILSDSYIIEYYEILLKYNDFNVENLKLSDEVKNYIRPTRTKLSIN